jgi:hypothetical protein
MTQNNLGIALTSPLRQPDRTCTLLRVNPRRIASVSAVCWNLTYLENDGRLEHAQQMAGHESPRTTKLYDRTKDEITLSEVERIRL